MNKLKLLVIFLFLTGLFSCYEPIPGSGVIQENEFKNLPSFNAIIFDGIGKVIVTPGYPLYVKIKTDENFMKLDSIKVEGNKLFIYTPKNINPTFCEIYVTIEDLSEFVNRSSGTIEIQNNFSQGATLWLTNTGSGFININQFNANSCEILNSGSGRINIETTTIYNDISSMTNSGSGRIQIKNVSAGSVNAELEGSGLIKIFAGTTGTSNVTNKGSGIIDFLGMLSTDAIANNRGSGKIQLNVTTTLTADITGSGDIEYLGNPVVNLTKTGSGNLVKLN